MTLRRLLFLFLLLVSFWTKAQLYPVFSQYYFNELVINPAYAGAHVQLSTSATFRNQWINFPGAPKTFAFTGHTSLLGGRLGVGLLINVDKIGSYSNKDITPSVAYKLKFPKSTLSFGMQGMMYIVGADFSNLLLKQPGDPGFVPINQVKPNVGVGLYYNRKNFFAGFSVPYLINTRFNKIRDSTRIDLQQMRYYFLRSGFIHPLDIKGNVKINPSILIRTQEGQPLSFDLNLGFIFYDVFSAGLSYRNEDAFITFVSLKVTEKIFFSYSYDYTRSDLNPYSSGTHELMLNYRQKITSVHKNLLCPDFHSYRE